MFLTQGSTGFPFSNAMSRKTIPAEIMQWNACAQPDTGHDAEPLAWRQIRLNILLLLALSTVVAIEVLALAAANIR